MEQSCGRGLLHLSFKMRMMFLLAFAAKEAWRQDLEAAAEWGMVLGSIPPAGRAG